MSPRSLDARFNGLVEELAKSSHGSAKLGEVKIFLDKELKGTAYRESFLLPKLLQEAVVWEDVRDSVWKSERSQYDYHFLSTGYAQILGAPPKLKPKQPRNSVDKSQGFTA